MASGRVPKASSTRSDDIVRSPKAVKSAAEHSLPRGSAAMPIADIPLFFRANSAMHRRYSIVGNQRLPTAADRKPQATETPRILRANGDATMMELAARLSGLGTPRMLVLGDLMLDRYTWGNATRVSPEAPVLVVRADFDEARLGGAASVAGLLRGLEVEVSVAGVIGTDSHGRILRKLLGDARIDTTLAFSDDSRPTTAKQRVLGRAAGRHPHQIVRIDHEEAEPIKPALARRLAAAVTSRLSGCQAVLISDYGKGVCTPQVLRAVIKAARRRGVPVLVDPARDADYACYAHASIIKPNRIEAQLASGRTIRAPGEALSAARLLCQTFKAEAVLITLESDGMALTTAAGDERFIAARPRAVYDVTGAGDMALAALALARAAGTGWSEAAELANIAAGLEVERLGVSPVSRAQWIAELAGAAVARQAARSKIVSLRRLASLVESHRRAGRSIVLTNGVFDLLHVGHVRCLEEAARLGDVLVVAINSDTSARLLKGPARPVIGQRGRATVVAALGCVDYVVIFGHRTPHRLLRVLRPDVLAKGGDYRSEQVVGREIVTAYDGRVAVTTRVAHASTTTTLKKLGNPGP